MRNFFKDFINVKKYKKKINTWENKYNTLLEKYVVLLEKEKGKDQNIEEQIKTLYKEIKKIKQKIN